jgi:23S rRNA (guanosine2251-2'-O)-methyltransferase
MNHSSKSKRIYLDQHFVYGINNCVEVLKQSTYQITSVVLKKDSTADRKNSLKDLIKQKDLQYKYIPREKYAERFGDLRTQGIVVYFSGRIIEQLPSFEKVEGDYCLLALDQIEDPQNLGQIIRTAECAGLDGIILSQHRSAGLTNAALQVSQGAFCHIPIYEAGNLHQALTQLKQEDFWITAVENGIDAKPWHTLDYTGKSVVVFGSEGHGIRKLILKTCDFIATIPMQGKIGSLNVTAAVSALVFERQRQLNQIGYN